MKNTNKFWLSLFLFIALCNVTMAQMTLGSSEGFLKNLKKNLAKVSGSSITLKVDVLKDFEGKVNYQKTDDTSGLLIGEIKNIAQSTFYVKIQDKMVEGHIILMATKEAYKYYSDKLGNAFVTKADINTLICVDYAKDAPQNPTGITDDDRPDGIKIGYDLLKLESFPNAKGCIYLDFDGYDLPTASEWNNGNSLTAAPSRATDAQILQQWEIVSEDFRAFSMNVTTNEAVFNSYPENKKIQVVITPTTTVAPNSGGIAYVDSFGSGKVCWVFYNGKTGGEACSHEVGHTLGLYHDGLINSANPKEGEYYGGISNNPWAPIMGNSYYKPVTQWSIGEYNGANNKQDDLANISDSKYGVGYRPDDYGNTAAIATELTTSTNGEVNKRKGIISSEADIDFFSFSTNGGDMILSAKTVSRDGDLDVVMKLYDESGEEIGSYTDTANGALNALIKKNLTAGKYFVSVGSTGAGDPVNGGYSAYASIGSYTIGGTISNGNLGIDIFNVSEVKVYPNPFNDVLHFNINQKISSSDVVLYDILGKIQLINLENKDDNNYTVNTDALSVGVYYLKINTDKGNFKALKIVKQ
jgi:hypothetical protein